MKIQFTPQTTKNILSLFDTNHDNSISLEEFEKQIAPFMTTMKPITEADIKSTKIDEETKKALANDMEKEQKKKVSYEDFSLKDVDVKESR